MTAPALDADAAAVLLALARAPPEAADLPFEACVLGFHSRRMERAVRELAQEGLVAVEAGDALATWPAQLARLTQRGLAALGELAPLGVEPSVRVGRRRAVRAVARERRSATVVDRRVGDALSP
jgi:hypothetical protein